MEKQIKIIKNELGYLVAAMPDGTVIPGQVDLVMSQKAGERGKVLVTVTINQRIDINQLQFK